MPARGPVAARPMTTLLLVNPTAGRGRAARLKAEVRQAIEAEWGEVVSVDTTAPLDAVERVRQWVAEGVERVVVLGGDGTLHEAANGVLRSGRKELPPIGVVPAGTGNDYAKLAGTAGLPSALAVRRLARGRIRYLDVGHAWDEYFLNAIGVGFDAEVARQVIASQRGSGLPAYLAAVLQVVRTFKPFRAEIEAPEGNLSDSFMLVTAGIGNVVGGGFRLTPAAVPDDGLLDVCAIRRLSTPGLLVRLPLTIPGWHTRLRVVKTFRTTHMTIIGLDGPLIAQFDGEVRSQEGRMEIRLEPARLPVMVVR
jgi:YegS/Rv2252/BmrU family lipid kinase